MFPAIILSPTHCADDWSREGRLSNRTLAHIRQETSNIEIIWPNPGKICPQSGRTRYSGRLKSSRARLQPGIRQV